MSLCTMGAMCTMEPPDRMCTMVKTVHRKNVKKGGGSGFCGSCISGRKLHLSSFALFCLPLLCSSLLRSALLCTALKKNDTKELSLKHMPCPKTDRPSTNKQTCWQSGTPLRMARPSFEQKPCTALFSWMREARCRRLGWGLGNLKRMTSKRPQP